MKKIQIILICILTFYTAIGETNPPHFTSEPTLSPDGLSIVFSYESDLWMVPTKGGTAYRLTAMEGIETLPRFSPDGKWIAFTASQNGAQNIYIMPATGGEIRQLTFHDANDHVDSWAWDSKWIFFSSDRYNIYSTYKISIDGGTPELMFEHYFNNPHHAVQHPITNDFYFTESWESFMFPQRKMYKGDHNPQILSYNSTTKKYQQHTQYNGKDMWPTIDKEGNVYYVSDEYNNEYNLYQLVNGQNVRLTQFDASIKRPQVSANGQKIVFEKDYQLWTYDLTTKTSQKVIFSLFSNTTLNVKDDFDTDGKISHFDISPDNKKIAFVSRGQLFVSDIEGKFIKQMPTKPSERIFEVYWSSDNKTLLYSQTHNGWANWFSIAANGNEKEAQITSDSKTNRQMTLNSKRTQGVYLSGRDEVKVLDFESKKVSTIINDEIWGLQNSSPRFSPNDKYIIFTAYRAFEQDIFIHEIATSKTINITNTGVTEADPVWSPDGKYIYFTTDRFTPSYPRGSSNSSIYRIPLYRFFANLKSEEFNKLFEEEEKDETKNDSNKKKRRSKETDEQKDNKNTVAIRIDLQNIEDRWESVDVSGGEQFAPFLIKKDDAQILFFISNHDKGENAIWTITYKPFEEPKTERLSQFPVGYSGYSLVQAKKDNYILANGNIYKANLNGNKLEKVDVKHTFSKSLSSEFNQMFYETWTILQENFYDENFHGVDWVQKRNYYAAFLPHIRTRENLRILLNDMLGELNASHMGFSSRGLEERPFNAQHTVAIGVIFSKENPYKIERIIRNSNIDITEPPLLPGDEVVAVNGKRVNKKVNREHYFTFPLRPNELELTITRNSKEQVVTVPTHAAYQISPLLYDEWIARNKQYVSNQSNGKIAYVHMKNMGEGALNQFIVDMTTYAEKAEALVLDLRYNRGGNVHDAVLQFLSQRPYLKWKYREGKLSPQPNFAPSAKPIVLLINEHSLSDAEMTAAGFRELGLGKIIGTETYRWIIFTSGKGLVDGSYVRVPAWGCYTLDGKDLEMEGVAPDIYVNTTFENRINNNDPQLDKAIEEIMKEL